ncbi:MAG: AgmX/PglI C-terminal domain-containing protein [Myxococcaceae bacterium]
MAELTESDLERLERYEAGTLNADERAAFERELATRPELAEALKGARAVAKALPGLASPTLDGRKAKKLVEGAAPPKRRARLWPVLVAAGLAAFGWWRFGFDEISNAGGVVTVDARTVVAGETIKSGDDVITGEVGVAQVRRRSSQWLVGPKSEVRLRGNVLEHGVLVIEGRAPVSVRGAWIEVDGEAVISVEPLEGSFRETGHLEPGDLMDGTRLRMVVGGTAAAAVAVYVLSGAAWVTPPDEPVAYQVDAGAVWTATPRPLPKSVRRGSDFEQWPTDVPRPVGASERLDAGQAAVVPVLPSGVAGNAGTTGSGATTGASGPGPVKVRHPASAAGIREAMKEVMPDLRDCYDGWVRQQPQLAGRVVVGFAVGSDDAGAGSVQDLSIIDGGLGHALLEGCVLNVMQGLSFEQPDGDGKLEVHYPLVFSSGDPDGGP